MEQVGIWMIRGIYGIILLALNLLISAAWSDILWFIRPSNSRTYAAYIGVLLLCAFFVLLAVVSNIVFFNFLQRITALPKAVLLLPLAYHLIMIGCECQKIRLADKTASRGNDLEV